MVRVQKIIKTYHTGTIAFPALNGIDLHIPEGEFVAIMGPSGSGKSTLLNVLGILDRYDEGEYRLNGILVKDLSEAQEAYFRSRLIGFVFQSFNLLPFMTAVDNAALPLYYQNVPRRQREARARLLLERMGLAGRADRLPNEMSGGERQRVAIARALVSDPPLILADEPTGNLDSRMAREVMTLLIEINRMGKTLVVVTHDENVAAKAHRTLRLQDGLIKETNG